MLLPIINYLYIYISIRIILYKLKYSGGTNNFEGPNFILYITYDAYIKLLIKKQLVIRSK